MALLNSMSTMVRRLSCLDRLWKCAQRVWMEFFLVACFSARLVSSSYYVFRSQGHNLFLGSGLCVYFTGQLAAGHNENSVAGTKQLRHSEETMTIDEKLQHFMDVTTEKVNAENAKQNARI